MSYTFSRRDFMKYTALTAVAVASAGMFTGCGENPNQPYSNNPTGTLSFGGSSGGFLGIGASHDAQTLKNPVYANGKFECDFEHTPVAEGFYYGPAYYKIVVEYSDKIVIYGNDSQGVKVTSDGQGAMQPNPKVPYKTHVTFAGIDYTDAQKVSIFYYPKTTAIGNTSDSYGDVHAGWNITSIIVTA